LDDHADISSSNVAVLESPDIIVDVDGGATREVKMLWSADWILGLPLLVLTIVGHVFALMLIATALLRLMPTKGRRYTPGRFVAAIALTALGATVTLGVEAGAWASLYLCSGALMNWHAAMLYSLEAITSYGHANVVLEDRWQLLGAIEATNGSILFGLTTAFLFAAINEVRPTIGPRSI